MLQILNNAADMMPAQTFHAEVKRYWDPRVRMPRMPNQPVDTNP